MAIPQLMTDPAAIAEFVIAGNATLTLRSARTDQHYTYNVRQAMSDSGVLVPRWFVKVLADGDQYLYVGMLSGNTAPLTLTKSSRFTDAAGCVRAFRYFWHHIVQAGAIAPDLEVRHEGRCGRCARELTHPESIDRGIGPDCWEIMHGAAEAA